MNEARQPQSCFTKTGLHKRGYSKRSSAVKAARSAQAEFGPMNVYRGSCGYYHVGHPGWAK